MADTPDPARARQIAARLRDLVREGRHGVNARHGLTCWGREGHDREWGLWRDEGDVNLVAWTDLGPHGMIWVVWVDDHDPNQMILALETRDDDADPALAEVRLMRLPGGAVAARLCAADYDLAVDRVYLPDATQVILRWCPHGRRAGEDAGFGLLDLDLVQRMPPIARHAPSHVPGHPALVRYQHHRASATGGWGIFDIHAGREVIAPIYDDLDWDDGRWVANRPDGSCDILAPDGTMLRHYAHTLHRGLTRGEWYARRGGLWGRAARDGTMIGEPRHDSLEALQREPVTLGPVRPPPAGAVCAVLPARLLRALRADLGREAGCYKYEGLADLCPDGDGEGYADLSRVLMPDGQAALRLALRDASACWLVLDQAWRGWPAGSLMRFDARPDAGCTALLPCTPAGDDETFVTAILGFR